MTTGEQSMGWVDKAEAAILAAAEIASGTEGGAEALGGRVFERVYRTLDGGFAIADNAEFTIDRDDYDLSVATLEQLDISSTKKQPIPEYEELVAGLSSESAVYLGRHVARGNQPELAVHLPIGRDFRLDTLLQRFNRVEENAFLGKDQVWHRLWGGYRFDHAANNANRSGLKASLALSDTSDPLQRTQQANSQDEPGLVHVGLDVPRQLEAFQAEQRMARSAGVWLSLESISQYLFLQTKHAVAGLPLRDRETATAFVHYPERELDGNHFIPIARWRQASQGLYGKRVDDSSRSTGVRRVVELGRMDATGRAVH